MDDRDQQEAGATGPPGISPESLERARAARLEAWTRRWGEPIRRYPPVHPGKTPRIEIVEFAPSDGRNHWTYASNGISDPRQTSPDTFEVAVPARDFELVLACRERAPWVQGLLADLGHFCHDKRAAPGHGGMIVPSWPLDKGQSHLKVALFLQGQVEDMDLDGRKLRILQVLGVTEPERIGLLEVGPTESVTVWVQQRDLMVVDFDRGCTLDSSLAPLERIAAANARFRSWPAAPPRVVAAVQAVRSLDRIIARFEQGHLDHMDREFDVLVRPLAVLEWDVVDLETAGQARTLRSEVASAYDDYLSRWI